VQLAQLLSATSSATPPGLLGMPGSRSDHLQEHLKRLCRRAGGNPHSACKSALGFQHGRPEQEGGKRGAAAAARAQARYAAR